jgi:hypothetical protein
MGNQGKNIPLDFLSNLRKNLKGVPKDILTQDEKNLKGGGAKRNFFN